MTELNVENVKMLRDEISKSNTYDQAMHEHECGSPACLSGHAYCLGNGLDFIPDNVCIQDMDEFSTEWLGLTEEQARDLFDDPSTWIGEDEFDECGIVISESYYKEPTNADACEVLEYLIESNEVDWEFVGF